MSFEMMNGRRLGCGHAAELVDNIPPPRIYPSTGVSRPVAPTSSSLCNTSDSDRRLFFCPCVDTCGHRHIVRTHHILFFLVRDLIHCLCDLCHRCLFLHMASWAADRLCGVTSRSTCTGTRQPALCLRTRMNQSPTLVLVFMRHHLASSPMLLKSRTPLTQRSIVTTYLPFDSADKYLDPLPQNPPLLPVWLWHWQSYGSLMSCRPPVAVGSTL